MSLFEDNYDYESARKAGLKPDKTGHWPSRVPKTGLILKNPKHPTFNKTLEEERRLGHQVYKGGDGRYYSRKIEEASEKPLLGQEATETQKYYAKVFDSYFSPVADDLDRTSPEQDTKSYDDMLDPAFGDITVYNPERGQDYVKKAAITYLGPERYNRMSAVSYQNSSYSDKLMLGFEVAEATLGLGEKFFDNASNIFNWKDFTIALTTKIGLTEGSYKEHQKARYEDKDFGKLAESVGSLAKSIAEIGLLRKIPGYKKIPGLKAIPVKDLHNAQLLKAVLGNSHKLGATFALSSLSDTVLDKVEGKKDRIKESFVKSYLLGVGLGLAGYGVKYGAIGLKNKYNKTIFDMHLKDIGKKLGEDPEKLRNLPKKSLDNLLEDATVEGQERLTKKEVFLARWLFQNLEAERAKLAGKTYENYLKDAFPTITEPAKFSAKKVITKDTSSLSKSQVTHELKLLMDVKATPTGIIKNGEITLDTLNALKTKHKVLIGHNFGPNSRKLADFLAHQKGLSASERMILSGYANLKTVPNKLLGISERGSTLPNWEKVYEIGDKYYRHKLGKQAIQAIKTALKPFGSGNKTGTALRLTDQASRYLYKLTQHLDKGKVLSHRIDKVIGGSVDKSDPLMLNFYSDMKTFFTSNKTLPESLSRVELKDFIATMKNFGSYSKAVAESQRDYPLKIAADLAADLAKANAKTAPGKIPASELTENLTLMEKVKSFVAAPYDNWITNTFKIAGGDPKVAFKVLNYSQHAQEQVHRIELQAGRAFYQMVSKNKDVLKLMGQKNTFVLESGKKVTLTNSEAMSLWATFKDDTLQMNLFRKMDLDSIMGTGPAPIQTCIVGDKLAHKFTNSDVQKIFRSLDPKLQKSAAKIYNYINKNGRMMFDKWSKQTYGKTFKLNKNYFPMRSSRNIFDTPTSELSEFFFSMENDKKYASIGGFQSTQVLKDLLSPFKTRVDKNTKALIIQPIDKAFGNYFNNMGGLYKGTPYTVLSHTFKDKKLTKTVFERMGQPGVNILNDLVKGVEDFRGLYQYNHPLSNAALKGLDYVRGVNLLFNLNAITNQGISGIMSSTMFPKEALKLSAKTSHKEAIKIINLLSNKNASIGLRMSRYHGLHSQIQQMVIMSQNVSKLEKAGMYGISAMDRATISRTSILPAYYEGKLKGLTGQKLLQFAAQKAQFSIDMTAPTSTAFTISSTQSSMKHSPFFKALYMYTSPIFKAYNFMRVNQVRLATNTITPGKAYATYLAVAGAMPLTFYYKKKYQQYLTRVGARKLGLKEGAKFDYEDTTMSDDAFGILFSIINQHPLGAVTNSILTHNAYNMMRGRKSTNVSLNIDKGILRNASQAFSALIETAKELGEEKYDKDTLYSVMDTTAKLVKTGVPYVGRILQEALPTKEKTTGFYTHMLHDAVRTRNKEKFNFAKTKLAKYGVYSDDVLKKARDKKKLDRKYDLRFVYKNLY